MEHPRKVVCLSPNAELASAVAQLLTGLILTDVSTTKVPQADALNILLVHPELEDASSTQQLCDWVQTCRAGKIPHFLLATPALDHLAGPLKERLQAFFLVQADARWSNDNGEASSQNGNDLRRINKTKRDERASKPNRSLMRRLTSADILRRDT